MRIESKPGSGARYYLRPSGSGQPFTLIYDSGNYTDTSFWLGGDVHSGVFGFDDLKAVAVYNQQEITTPVYPGGPIVLEVVDNALQTNSTSLFVNCITGVPPVAVITGPTNGAAGVLLSYEAYLSSDDHGIASYTWDFGDGSPAVFGPAVSHFWSTPGIYTNRLVVMDYAGQRTTNTVLVTVGPGNALVCVPWRIIGGVELPHETYPGKAIRLKAVGLGLPVPFTYVWDYGDGSGSVTGQVTTASTLYNLEASHAYSRYGNADTPYLATVAVQLTNGTVLSDSYPLLVKAKSLDVEMNVAIDEGLWYLHKVQERSSIDAFNLGGRWTFNGSGYSGYFANSTASAVQAFGINGHLVTDDPTMDPYVETVQRGVNSILADLTAVSIGLQTHGDPDVNHNGIGLTVTGSRQPYELGPVMDALVAVARPELLAAVGGNAVKGRALRDIMQDMVDTYAWAQTDHTGSYGGAWQYSWNSQNNDNSASQWAAIGFIAGERYWGITVPTWVKERNRVWLSYSQSGSTFGYTGTGCAYDNCAATTPSALVQLSADGVQTTDAQWQAGEGYLANNWNWFINLNFIYAEFATVKALRGALPEPVTRLTATGKDWFRDPNNGIARVTIDRQRADGSWLCTRYGWIEDAEMATAWSVIMLTSSLFQRGPVAVIHAKPNPTAAGYPVVFDGSASYHQHPAYRISEHRWDFDASNGVDFDHPDALGPVVTNYFAGKTNFTVTLQVRDNATPQLNGSASVDIAVTLPPYPPTADAGGPYVLAVGEDLHLDGSGSFDIDMAQGDYITAYDWEINNHLPYDFNDGIIGQLATVTAAYAAAGRTNVALRVLDATSIVFPTLGLTNLAGVDFADVYVYNRVITNPAARAKDTKIQLTWTKAGDYAVVHRSTLGPDRGFSEIGRTDSSYATFLDTNVQYNVNYYYRLFAYQTGNATPLGISDPVLAVSHPRLSATNAPYFTCNPPRGALVGNLYQFTLTAASPNGAPFIFNKLCGPTNLTLDSTSGLVQFVPTPAQLGEQPVCFEVTNTFGRDELNYTIVVLTASNQPPVAKINGPYSGLAGQPIQFSSAGTSDPENDPLSYYWNFGDGSAIETNANPSHTYTALADYTVSLFVNDGQGNTSYAFTNAVVSRANRPPVANAGFNQLVYVGQTVHLNGSASYDLDPQPLYFSWDFLQRPTNSTAVISNANISRPYFVVDQPGTYVARLIVNDGVTNSQPDAIIIRTLNSAPVANAGPPQRVPVGQVAHLDGTRSYDVDHDPLTYRWTLVSQPTNSVAVLSNANTPAPTFGMDLDGVYVAQLIVNDGQLDSQPATVRVATRNFPPVITTLPTTSATPQALWSYDVQATDVEGSPLTFTLLQSPAGMAFTAPQLSPTNSQLSWTPTTAQLGSFPVALGVTDTEGASVIQAFTLNVAVDTQPPAVTVALLQGEIQVGTGQWAARLGSTAIFRVLAADNVAVTGETLRVANQPITLDASGVGSIVAANAGLWQVVATATDAQGNVGTTNTTILFYDPSATNTIFAQILSPTNGQVVTKPVPVIGTITNATDLLSYRVDFARAADVDPSNVSFEGPQFTTLTNVLLPPGTRSIMNAVLAQFDPTMLLNDDYVIRLVASDGRSLWYEPVVVSVSGNLKFGEFHLEFTDLQVPLVGVPITITRVYDTREANRTRDFGYGWSLGVQDAKIRKTLRNGTMFIGSRVYINTPDGKRVGFTAGYQPSSWLFPWIGDVLLQPDPGVYEKLEIVGKTVIESGGVFYGGLGDENYSPTRFRLTLKDGTVYDYDEHLGLQQVTDLNQNTLSFTTNGIYHSSGARIEFVRDAQGRIAQIIDPAGNRLSYTYDPAGDLRSFTDQVTNLTQYYYSTVRAHYLTNIIDPLGHQALRMEYDDAGRLLGIRDANGNLTSQEFPDPNTAVFKDANGHTNIVRYDDNGNEVMKAIPGISTNTFAYDANNNEIWRQDARGFVTTRAYDSRGNLTNIVDALSNVTSIAYNDLNKPTSVTDALGRTTQFRYDSQGGLTNVVNALGDQAAFTHDAQGRVTSTADFNGHTTFYDYTSGCSCGKPGKVINPDGTFQLYEYNAQGQTTREVDELGHETFSFFDDAGRLLWVRDAESNVTRYAYAGALKISETDPLGRTTWYAYDSANRQIAITNAMGGLVRFEYDNGGNRTAVIDPVGNVTRFHYDSANRLTHQVDPWGRTNFFAYDAAGNRTESVDRNGRKRTFGYDAQNRRTNEFWWEGTNVVRSIGFTFNALGIMTGASDPASRLAFDFDALNRLERATQSGVAGMPDFTLTYGYDGMTKVVSVADNWGAQVASTYDARNRLTERVWQGAGLLGARLHFDYDAAGNRTNVLRYADTAGTVLAGQSRYGYSALGAISDILHVNATNAVLAAYHYQRDPAQQIISRTLKSQLATFNYDLTGQLTNALYSSGQPNEGYDFDANGNRIGGGYVVTTNNQIVADSTNVYSYDLEGSMLSRSNTATHATTTCRYDHRNRLISVVDKDASGTVTQTVEFT